MATGQELLQIEREAAELKNNLAELHSQVGSYALAKETLEQTNERLEALIEKTQVLAEESHRLVKVTIEIGGVRLLEKLSALEEKQAKRLTIITVMVAVAILIGIIQIAIR
jgi:hypothetical protein